MEYFDLHCDTIAKIRSKRLDFESDRLQVNAKDFPLFEKYGQCFALWLDDELRGEAAFEKASELYEEYIDYKNAISKFENVRPVLTLENAASLGGKLENLEIWKSRSVAVMGLTWNGANELGFGADFKRGGLTRFGKEAVCEAERLNVVVDVSHLNEDGFRDVARIAKKPFIASHSNCYAVRAHRRCLKDHQIKEIISRGGLIGINFYPIFLGRGDVFELIYKNICHLIELGGEKAIAFGSDFDGAEMDARLNRLGDATALRSFLIEKGVDSATLDDIFYKNAKNFFNDILNIQ